VPICLALVLLAAVARAGAQPAPAGGSPWERAVEQFLSGDRVGATTTILSTPAADLTRSSARAFDAWRLPSSPAADAAARRLAVRRWQASALLPLEILVAVSGRSLAPAPEVALEDASREAWRRLDAFDDEEGSPQAASVRQFRTWWRLGVIQHLIGSGRFRDVPREADAARPPDEDRAAAATLALLRGVALETRARLADEAPGGTVGVTMRRLAPPSRLGPMMLAMDEAGKAYRRALEIMPDDREASLRLGRVAIERNRLDDAERVLVPLVQSSCRDTTCGLAHLFLGEVHEARQELERAVGAYARASSVQAVRPAALIAMIQATLRRGNARGAYDLTRQFATPAALAPTQVPDAWSQYIGGRLIEGDRILARVSAAVVP